MPHRIEGLVEVSGMRLRLRFGSGSGILERWGSDGEGSALVGDRNRAGRGRASGELIST